MRLSEYIDKKHDTMEKLVERSGVSYQTIKSARRGMLIKLYDVAKKISEATGGLVTISELCEEPAPNQKEKTA